MLNKHLGTPTAGRRSWLALSASAAALCALSTPVAAQDASNMIEELVVTAQKKEEALQDVPIAVSAFDQSALEKAKIDGGSNLVLAVPNVNFSKGNFGGGYNFQIRGIGSKLVASTGDAGTGIHLNNSPLIANNLFETEFYDVERVEVLRGPQGTLYGRNSTGGAVNIITAKPQDDFQANVRAEYGNYNAFKARGMVNLPLNDMVALRLAGTYLSRDGFGENLVTGNDADDRELFGLRGTLSFSPSERLQTWAMWDHFEEDDSRSRIGRQFCAKDPGPTNIGGLGLSAIPAVAQIQRGFLGQGCRTTPLKDAANGTLNSQSTLVGVMGALTGLQTGDAYAGKTQSSDIRDIESAFDPIYKAKTDTYQFNAQFQATDELTLHWLTAYTTSKLYTRQDYNRYVPAVPFNTTPNPVNAFAAAPGYAQLYGALFPGGFINDPQSGRLNRFTDSDISGGETRQWSQELRLQSDFSGAWNFNLGGFMTRFSSQSDYIVMSNAVTAYAQILNATNTGNPNCTSGPGCIAVDPSRDPTRLGHNYYDSYSSYDLTSYAVFGELYWQMSDTFKWTLGLRYTVDDKQLENHPVGLLTPGSGIPLPPPGQPLLLKAKFKEPTGRFGFDWKPDLSFTDDTLVYAFYSRGYKAGGLNTPSTPGIGVAPTSPTFDPEFINAYEIGMKNTLLGGAMQLNLTGFYYDYKGYQVAKIVNRAATNENIDAKVGGVELESIWQPVHGLRLNAAIGYLKTEIQNGSSIDVFNRTQGNPALTQLKASSAANCVVPTTAAQTALAISNGQVPGTTPNPFALLGACNLVSAAGAGTNIGGTGAIAVGTNAFGGLVTEGVPVNLSGKELPNAPEWTISLGAQYMWTLGDWDVTARGDYYRQTDTYARIYNSAADKLEGWQNVNLTLTAQNAALGLEVGAFVKNATDEEAITDFFLADEAAGLFRNVFYGEPRTYGVSISKRW